ncbi:hypothetical protein CTAYLR_006761 [Chrysophaeum taylorii]|uniref:AMP-dependent synthetase/ligase domain-containing protein n=1 Tax=Chrysophaeum taylorii TaxID=2483200 RepID=A0AAD7UBA1_9STRA|nr:hypothetical protein CTAYLR_006761 [Chrysophaeum taylorii]
MASSFGGALQAQVEAHGEKVFVSVWSTAGGIEERVSFCDFRDAVAAGAAGLEGVVGPGDRVALLSKGVLEFYVCVLSLQWRRATPVALNWRQSPENLKGMIHDAGAKLVVVGSPYHALAQELGVPTVSLDGPWRGTTRAPLEVGRRSDEAMVFFTSGSTSRPKPVLHTNETLLWTAEHFVFPPNTTTTLCFMPNFHVLMCFQNFLVPLARGVGASILGGDEPITAQLLLKACAALKPSTIDTVPFIMAEWSTLSPSELAPLAACAAVRSGGAPLNAAVAERLVAAGVNVKTHYGQTEAPGMQLVTIDGAAPSELAIFRPAMSVVELKLDGNDGQEGELLIKGCRGSSRGYLSEGRLVPNSSRTGADGWHRTGDVFRRVKTVAGAIGLEHAMRVDDIILLSTGEMFNPVPMEATIAAHSPNEIVARLAILGQNRPAPFLVVEGRSLGASITDVWAGVERANLAAAEYARIRGPEYVLVLDAGERLPHSAAKGNVIRKQAEAMVASRLDDLTFEAEENLDWAALEAEEDDGEGGVKMGLDSLGVATIMKRGQREANRVGDNIKAWTVTAIVMSHWYRGQFLIGRHGIELNAFTAATVGGSFRSVSFGVQGAILVLMQTVGFNPTGLLPTMTALISSIGWSDSVRDGPERRVVLGHREITMGLLILLFKILVMPLSVYFYQNRSWKPESFILPAPAAIVWFVYALLWYRILVRCAQAVASPNVTKISLLAGAVSWLFITNEGYNEKCPFCTIHAFPAGINAVLSFLFDPDSYLIIDGTSAGKIAPVYRRVLAYDTPRIDHGFNWMSARIMNYLSVYLVAYYYGTKIVSFCKKYLPYTSVNVATSIGLSAVWLSILLNWTSSRRDFGIPAHLDRLRSATAKNNDDMVPAMLEMFDDMIPWQEHVTGTIWHHTNARHTDTFQDWNPTWARPFYLVVCWSFTFAIALFLFAACVSAPFRANRCGNAALGKYYSTYLVPWYVTLVGYCTAALGREADATSFPVQLLQIIMLLFGPLAFVYVLCPVSTALVVGFPKVLIWIAQNIHRPRGAMSDVRDWCARDALNAFSGFWKQYFDECRRDLAALSLWLKTWAVDPLDNLAGIIHPAEALLKKICVFLDWVASPNTTTAKVFATTGIPLIEKHNKPTYGAVDPTNDGRV